MEVRSFDNIFDEELWGQLDAIPLVNQWDQVTHRLVRLRNGDNTLFSAATPSVSGTSISLAKACRDALDLILFIQSDEPQFPRSCLRSRNELLITVERMLVKFCNRVVNFYSTEQWQRQSSAPPSNPECELEQLSTRLFPAPTEDGDIDKEVKSDEGVCASEKVVEEGPHHISVSKTSTEEDDPEEQEYSLRRLAPDQCLHFVGLVALWHLRQASIHATLLLELGTEVFRSENQQLLPSELLILSRIFEQHDPNLSGMVEAGDVPWLLKDLWAAGGVAAGEGPTSKEIALVMHTLLTGDGGKQERGVTLEALARWWVQDA